MNSTSGVFMLSWDADDDFPSTKLYSVYSWSWRVYSYFISESGRDTQQSMAVSMIQHWSGVQKLYQWYTHDTPGVQHIDVEPWLLCNILQK